MKIIGFVWRKVTTRTEIFAKFHDNTEILEYRLTLIGAASKNPDSCLPSHEK
jgi:hypothetical protein